MASDSRALRSASNDNIKHWKYENSAEADRNKTQPRTEHTPITDHAAKHAGTKATDGYHIFVRELDLYASRNAKPPIRLANPQNLENYVLNHLTT